MCFLWAKWINCSSVFDCPVAKVVWGILACCLGAHNIQRPVSNLGMGQKNEFLKIMRFTHSGCGGNLLGNLENQKKHVLWEKHVEGPIGYSVSCMCSNAIFVRLVCWGSERGHHRWGLRLHQHCCSVQEWNMWWWQNDDQEHCEAALDWWSQKGGPDDGCGQFSAVVMLSLRSCQFETVMRS